MGYYSLFFIVTFIFINKELDAQEIKLSWEANPENDIMYYCIYKDTTTSPKIEVSKVSATNTTYNDNKIVIGQKYYYRIAAVDSADNMSEFSDEISIMAQRSASITNENGIPHKTELSQNYPNPFNPETTIEYTTTKEGQINLAILNILGREVRKLVDEYHGPGYYAVKWDGKDNAGNKVSTGIYLCQLLFENLCQTRKLVLEK